MSVTTFQVVTAGVAAYGALLSTWTARRTSRDRDHDRLRPHRLEVRALLLDLKRKATIAQALPVTNLEPVTWKSSELMQPLLDEVQLADLPLTEIDLHLIREYVSLLRDLWYGVVDLSNASQLSTQDDAVKRVEAREKLRSTADALVGRVDKALKVVDRALGAHQGEL